MTCGEQKHELRKKPQLKSCSFSAAWQIFQRAKSAATESNVAVQVEMLLALIKKKQTQQAGEADMRHVFFGKQIFIIKNINRLFSNFQMRLQKC